MAWNVVYKSDTEDDVVGTVIASNDNFTYSDRVDTSKIEEVGNFVTSAKEKYNSSVTKKGSEDDIATAILAEFNK